jgi:ornithine cyclodeaminase/alanine dehydrogenase-like protein (mu-crystallin family)
MKSDSVKSPGLLVVNGADVRRALPMSECIEVIERAMRAVSRGDAEVPLRTVMAIPGTRNRLAAMPGYVGEPRGLGAKILALYPENPRRGLSSHVGLVVLFDAEMGLPVAVMDAQQITAVRTAAATAVATRALARADAGDLAILGVGEQAGTHLAAIPLVRTLRSIRVWGRSFERAQAFAQREGARLALRMTVCRTAHEAVDGADIVCTLTGAREPILNGAWLAAGAHVNLVGASRIGAREVDDEVVTRSRYFVDLRRSAHAEAGELRHALDAGLVGENHLLGEIGEVLNGTVPGRTSDTDITVYKSVGIAAQDLAAAHHIFERARKEGLGTLAPF